jgi:hypothetical protein
MINENENGIEAKKVGEKEDRIWRGWQKRADCVSPVPPVSAEPPWGLLASIRPKLSDLIASYQNGRSCYGNPADYPICKHQSKS